MIKLCPRCKFRERKVSKNGNLLGYCAECSNQMTKDRYNKNHKVMIAINKNCVVCSKEFEQNKYHPEQKCCCKECNKKYYVTNNREKVRTQMRKYGQRLDVRAKKKLPHRKYMKGYNQRPKVKIVKKRYEENHRVEKRLYGRQYTKLHIEELRKKGKEYHKTHKEEHKIYYLNHKDKTKMDAQRIAKTRIEIPTGQLCQRCNESPARERHHEDYSKPLEVIFLCRSCHKIRTYELKRIHNA